MLSEALSVRFLDIYIVSSGIGFNYIFYCADYYMKLSSACAGDKPFN